VPRSDWATQLSHVPGVVQADILPRPRYLLWVAPTDSAPRLSRRAILQLGGVALLTGCTLSDPTLRTTAPPSGSAATTPATPTPGPGGSGLSGAAAAARLENNAAGLAAALLNDAKSKLDATQRRLLTAIRDDHRAHTLALLSAQPITRPTSTEGPPPPVTPPPKPSRGALISAEQALAGHHASLTVGTRGLTTLLWASLSVAATTYAGALQSKGAVPVSAPTAANPTPAVVDDVTGLQAMVSQLYAVVYGYQIALGRMPMSGRQHDQALADLQARQALRDQLISVLIARTADVPVAAPAYVPSARVVDPASASQFVAKLETALLPYAGQWLAAAASEGDHNVAWSTLGRTAALARSWGAPVAPWPGWP
jgi:hypothetical protein